MSTVTTDYNALVAAAEKAAVTSIKQAQDVSLRAAKVAVGLIPDAGAATGFPTPREIVENSFAFANEVLTLQKAYALELADIAAEGASKVAKPPAKKS
jgi:hypothetical protein